MSKHLPYRLRLRKCTKRDLLVWNVLLLNKDESDAFVTICSGDSKLHILHHRISTLPPSWIQGCAPSTRDGCLKSLRNRSSDDKLPPMLAPSSHARRAGSLLM
jgi:hypothetical protein